MSEETQITLRDTLENAFDEVEKTESEVQTVATVETAKSEPVETAQQKADRIRDDQGRFQKNSQEAKTEVTRAQRPSSWKKDYWDHWDKLDPNLANYIAQREQEYAKGVSTYKSEAEKAKEIFDAIAPYQQYINIRGGNPREVISNLLQTANTFNSASQQDKISALMQIAQQFNIPLQQAFQGEPQQVGYMQQLAN